MRDVFATLVWVAVLLFVGAVFIQIVGSPSGPVNECIGAAALSC